MIKKDMRLSIEDLNWKKNVNVDDHVTLNRCILRLIYKYLLSNNLIFEKRFSNNFVRVEFGYHFIVRIPWVT